MFKKASFKSYYISSIQIIQVNKYFNDILFYSLHNSDLNGSREIKTKINKWTILLYLVNLLDSCKLRNLFTLLWYDCIYHMIFNEFLYSQQHNLLHKINIFVDIYI